jgi:hypothetical protein
VVCVLLKEICVSLLFRLLLFFFFLRRGSARVLLKFLYHGQYLGFFEKFSQRKKKERKEQESHLLL